MINQCLIKYFTGTIIKIQWNAEVRTSEIGKMLKPKQMLVRISGHLDFKPSGPKKFKRVRFGLLCTKLNEKCPKTKRVWISDTVRIPNHLELGQKLNIPEPN